MSEHPLFHGCPHGGTSNWCPICLRDRVADLEAERDRLRKDRIKAIAIALSDDMREGHTLDNSTPDELREKLYGCGLALTSMRETVEAVMKDQAEAHEALAATTVSRDWLRQRLDVYEEWKRAIEDSGDKDGWADSAAVRVERDQLKSILDRLVAEIDGLKAERDALKARDAEWLRLARAVEAAPLESLGDALHALAEHARGNGWTDVPKPVALQMAEREDVLAKRVVGLEAERDAAVASVQRLRLLLAPFAAYAASVDADVSARKIGDCCPLGLMLERLGGSPTLGDCRKCRDELAPKEDVDGPH